MCVSLTGHLAVVFLQLMNLVPFGAVLLVNVNIVVVGTQRDFWKGRDT